MQLNKYNIYFKDIINIVMIYYNNLSKDNDKLIPLNNLYLKLKRTIIKNIVNILYIIYKYSISWFQF